MDTSSADSYGRSLVNFPRITQQFAAWLAASLLASSLTHAEPKPLRANDVVALVGGESMVVAGESGAFELALLRAAPLQPLHFRSLAWEGDTVFEQRRDLNFPPLESQLDAVGASIVAAQFGEMESLAGESKIGDFVAAYEGLIDRINSKPGRRIILIGPFVAAAKSAEDFGRHSRLCGVYSGAIRQIAERRGLTFMAADSGPLSSVGSNRAELRDRWIEATAAEFARQVSGTLAPEQGAELTARWEALRPLVQAKNRLWFNYWRPQNWAFLNGDRTAQPSSRDHLDPSKRWFPGEMEQFLPLIEAKEKEIKSLASKLAQP